MIDSTPIISDVDLENAFGAGNLRGVANMAILVYCASQAGERVVSVVSVAPNEFVRTMADGTSYHGFYEGFNTGGPKIRWTKMPNVVETEEKA